MTMVNKDSQSAIEQKKKKRTTLTFIVGVCLLFISVYLNLAIGSSKIQFTYAKNVSWFNYWWRFSNCRFIDASNYQKSFGFTTDFWCECRCFLRYCTYNCTYTITRLLLYNFSDNWCLLRRFYCLYIVWLY